MTTAPFSEGSIRRASLDETVAYLANTRILTELDLTRPDFRMIYDCIDPRTRLTRSNKRIKTAVQVGGGGALPVDIRATAETAKTGKLVSALEAFEAEKRIRKAASLGGHMICKFLDGNNLVNAEKAQPSGRTLDQYQRLLHRLGLLGRVDKYTPLLQAAAALQRDDPIGYGMSAAILGHFDRGYPDHDNIHEVFGDNQAQAYVRNLVPEIGLDRNFNRAALFDEGIDYQFYFECRDAAFADMVKTYGAGDDKLSRRDFSLFAGAFALTTCATETVLTSLRPTVIIELDRTHEGLIYREVEYTE